MEEIIQTDGRVRNANFTDYLLPTMLDMPDVVASLASPKHRGHSACCLACRRLG